MKTSTNRLLIVATTLLVSLLGLFLFKSNPNPAPIAPEIDKSQAVAASEPVDIPPQESLASVLEVDTASDVDWSACTDNYGSDECLSAITPLIAEVGVVGDLSWVDLIDRFDDNLKVISQVVEDPACIPPATGLDPTVEHALTESADKTAGQVTANCGAKAYGEVGVLMRQCNSYPRRKPPPEEQVLGEAAGRGITDLLVLYKLEQSARYGQLEHQWLEKKCASLVAGIKEAPAFYHQLSIHEQNTDWVNNDFPGKSTQIKQLFKSRTYIERSVLLGDYRLAGEYIAVANSITGLAGPNLVYGYEHERPLFEPLKQRDREMSSVIDKIITHVPAAGFAAKATHLVQRYPPLWYTDPSDLEDIREQNESPGRIKGTPQTFIPEDDWYQRALDIATYGIAADRMNGVPADLPSNPLQSDVFHSEFWDDSDKKMYLERFLDANDWEYASQKANELVAAAKQRQNNP